MAVDIVACPGTKHTASVPVPPGVPLSGAVLHHFALVAHVRRGGMTEGQVIGGTAVIVRPERKYSVFATTSEVFLAIRSQHRHLAPAFSSSAIISVQRSYVGVASGSVESSGGLESKPIQVGRCLF